MGEELHVLDESTLQSLQAQSAQLGMDLSRLLPAGGKARQAEVAFDVLEENWQAVQVFEASQSQWRVALAMMGAPVYLGLDYPGVQVVAWALGVTRKAWPDVLMRLQVMEMEGARLLNSRA